MANCDAGTCEGDIARLLWLARWSGIDYIAGHDIHANAADVADGYRRNEPTDSDYLEAIRLIIDDAIAGSGVSCEGGGV